MKLEVDAFAEFAGQGVMAGVLIGDHEHYEPYVSLAHLCKQTIDAHRLVGGDLVATAYNEIVAMRKQLTDALEYIDSIEPEWVVHECNI